MTTEPSLLPPWVVQHAVVVPDIHGDPMEVWQTTATFDLYDDATAFVKWMATRKRRLRVGSVHVAYEDARP